MPAMATIATIDGINNTTVTMSAAAWRAASDGVDADGYIARIRDDVVTVRMMAAGTRAAFATVAVGATAPAATIVRAAVVAIGDPNRTRYTHPINADARVTGVWSHHVAAVDGITGDDARAHARALRASRA